MGCDSCSMYTVFQLRVLVEGVAKVSLSVRNVTTNKLILLSLMDIVSGWKQYCY